jgi:hypothetical protein
VNFFRPLGPRDPVFNISFFFFSDFSFLLAPSKIRPGLGERRNHVPIAMYFSLFFFIILLTEGGGGSLFLFPYFGGEREEKKR